MGLRPAWSTKKFIEWLGSGLHKEALSQKTSKNKNKEKKRKNTQTHTLITKAKKVINIVKVPHLPYAL